MLEGIQNKELYIDIHNCSLIKLEKEAIEIYIKEILALMGNTSEVESLHHKIDINKLHTAWQQDMELEGSFMVRPFDSGLIVIHVLKIPRIVYIDITSYDSMNKINIVDFTKKYFEGRISNSGMITRA